MLSALRRPSLNCPRTLRLASMSHNSASRFPLVQNASRPANWKAAAPFPPSGVPTYAAQSSLPRLPVPELVDTVRRLKESLKPLARDAKELQEAERKVDEFAAGLAPELQNRLLQRRDATQHWLEDWWDDGGYLGYRDSVVVNVSYFYGFDEPPAHMPKDALNRAAGLVRAMLLFRQRLLKGEVKPDATKEGPQCMDTWRWMFDACRIPGLQGLDWGISHNSEGSTGTSGHIAVLRQGRVWKLDAWKDGRLLSTTELEHQLKAILKETSREYPGVGILTAANRDFWATEYSTISSNSHNADILNTIQSSAFVLCLDTESPSDIVSFSRGLWHGAQGTNAQTLGLRNRWVDKPVQLIVFANGQAGIMGEHSVMDGTPTARMCDEVLDALYDPKFDHGPTPSVASAAKPQPLDWQLEQSTLNAIQKATEDARALIDGQTLGYRLTAYGKQTIKAFGVSPDSWAQMIVQLAYARFLRATGKPREGGTYEAASTRKFLKGRTEAIRVVSEESDRFVAAMDDEGVNVREKKRLFADAAKKHIERAKLGGNGQGVDRHLLGLRALLQESEEVPALYSDPLFLRSKNWVLSTSAVFSKHFPAYGWGEVVPEGFGVAYMTGYDDRLQFTITSRTDMPNERFCEEIATAAVDLYALFEEKASPKL